MDLPVCLYIEAREQEKTRDCKSRQPIDKEILFRMFATIRHNVFNRLSGLGSKGQKLSVCRVGAYRDRGVWTIVDDVNVFHVQLPAKV